MNGLQKTALVLVFIGALNWGLIGIFAFDLVAYLFGNLSMLTRIVYVVVFLAGLYSLTLFGTETEEDREEHRKLHTA
jgi:uncharacterized protein